MIERVWSQEIQAKMEFLRRIHEITQLISKAFSSNSLFDWHRLVCFPLSVLSSGPWSQGVSLTSSIKSRINTFLESTWLPVPEALSRQAAPPPTTTHNDAAKDMKRLVNQKLSDFNIKGALQTLSGNSSFAKPNEESLNTLQQKHPHPQMLTPHQFASVQPKYVLQSLPSLMVQGQAQTAYAHNIWKTASPSQQAMPALLSSSSLTELINYLPNGHLPTSGFSSMVPNSIWALQKQRRHQTHCRRMHIPTSYR